MLATCFRFAVCMLFVVHSQTDVSSFGIVTSADSPAGQSVHLALTLSWNTEQWECVINTTIAPDTYYGCISTDIEPEATLITDTLPSNTYSMKMNLIDIGTEIEDLIRIETVRVIDDDSNYYEISDFCVPKPFSKTDARGTSLEFLECCYWSDRYKYNNFALGGVQNAALKIAYIMFRSNVLTYKNEAHEGAVKPPLITQIGITTLSSPDSASSATFALTLHWDSDVYEWSNVRPSSTNTSFTKTFTESDDFCEFSSGFSLEFSSTSPTSDTVGIDRILVTDEADYSYDIEYFCNSDKIKNDQKSGDLGRVCDGKWSSYDMYDGFIYNGSKSMYFIWSDDVFLNANTSQQAFALNDSILSNYNCSKNTAPSSKITIFKDDMNDPNATGWAFTGSYTESLNAVNCPGGSLDSCSRIAGTGEMVMQVNVAQYANIMIQYDMRLSSMPSGKRCYLYYNFDGGSWVYAQYRLSSSTDPVLYANETYSPPDHIDSGYSLLGIKFTNNALYSTEYCWLDHIYVFGDYLIAFDNFNTAPYTGWSLYTPSTISTHTECWSGACLGLFSGSYWSTRQYDNINLYNNLVLSFDMKTYYNTGQIGIKCKLYYSYDAEPAILIGWIPSASGGSHGAAFYDLKYAIPDASVCGATAHGRKTPNTC